MTIVVTSHSKCNQNRKVWNVRSISVCKRYLFMFVYKFIPSRALIGPFFQLIKDRLFCYSLHRSSSPRSSFLRLLLSVDKCQTKNFEEINILIIAILEFYTTKQLFKYRNVRLFLHFNCLGILNTCNGSTRCSAVSHIHFGSIIIALD